MRALYQVKYSSPVEGVEFPHAGLPPFFKVFLG